MSEDASRRPRDSGGRSRSDRWASLFPRSEPPRQYVLETPKGHSGEADP